MRVGIYARVSTSSGSQTCENQLLELRRYCQARGWIVHAEYTDEMSGAKDRRPRPRFRRPLCFAQSRHERHSGDRNRGSVERPSEDHAVESSA